MSTVLSGVNTDLYDALRTLEAAVMRWGLDVTDRMCEGSRDTEDANQPNLFEDGNPSLDLFEAIGKARLALAKAESGS